MLFRWKLIPFSVPEMHFHSIFILLKKIIKKQIYDGPDIVNFERQFAEYMGVRYAICFSSARYSLFLIYKFFNCKNKKVIFPAYTCIPALDALRWAGGKPYFVDIDLNTYNPLFEKELLGLKDIGAISLSFLYGMVGDIERFLEFARSKKIPVIVDAAIAIGGMYKDNNIGMLGDVAVFSLQSSKILTSWKGGVVTTNNKAMYVFLCQERKKMRNISFLKLFFNILLTYFRAIISHPRIYGLTFYPIKKITYCRAINKIVRKIVDQTPDEAISGESLKNLPKSEMVRFTNLQASIVSSSFKKIDLIINKRRHYAKLYTKALKKNLIVRIPIEIGSVQHAYGRYPIRIKGFSKYDLEKILFRLGIEIGLYYPYICPNTHYMRELGFCRGEYPNAIIASHETVLLPFHTFLKEKDIFSIIESIKRISR